MKGGAPEPNQEEVLIPPIPPYEYPAPSPIVDRKPIVRAEPKEPPPKYRTYVPRPTRPFIESKEPDLRGSTGNSPPVEPVGTEPKPVVMSHPATVQLPPAQDVERYKPEVERKPAPTSTAGSKPEEKSSIQRKNLPKPEEKASKPEVGASTAGTKNKKGLKFNGRGGRIHTEAHIDRILDEYILTGKLPSYVSERQRYDYRHHMRLPERRQLLGKQQAGDKASGTSSTAETKDNITPFRGTGTHNS